MHIPTEEDEGIPRMHSDTQAVYSYNKLQTMKEEKGKYEDKLN